MRGFHQRNDPPASYYIAFGNYSEVANVDKQVDRSYRHKGKRCCSLDRPNRVSDLRQCIIGHGIASERPVIKKIRYREVKYYNGPHQMILYKPDISAFASELLPCHSFSHRRLSGASYPSLTRKSRDADQTEQARYTYRRKKEEFEKT